MKILPVGAEVLYMDGQTDMTKLTVVSDNFAKAAKKKGIKISTRNCLGHDFQ